MNGRAFILTTRLRAILDTLPGGGTACGVLGERIVVVGGEGNPVSPLGVFEEVEVYSPALNRWTLQPPMVTPRHGMGAAVWDYVLYVPGGAWRELFAAVDTHEVLRFVPEDH